MQEMNNPLALPENEWAFKECLKLRFKEWARLRKNLLARRRYRKKKSRK
jgi:hypothetical protein